MQTELGADLNLVAALQTAERSQEIMRILPIVQIGPALGSNARAARLGRRISTIDVDCRKSRNTRGLDIGRHPERLYRIETRIVTFRCLIKAGRASQPVSEAEQRAAAEYMAKIQAEEMGGGIHWSLRAGIG